ncbi:alpha/beta hydrolase [Intrasporangium sp. YIM S08009]|uniref:alpha/beta hydrolase n=1 Tax=Intrasporangium zincisolvens TaxID=3080018 RepID=UPI002B05B756|nr:alpha/beta fold hydrolase [Intrasporangium sp. YIM S08009]
MALILVLAPVVPAQEPRMAGAVLVGFAVGWAMVAGLTTRFTDQAQPWALVPAGFMGVGGVLLMAFGRAVSPVLDWVWPPVLLAMVVWMAVQVRRHLRGPSRRWLLFPVLGVLALASVGGGFQTVGAALAAGAHPVPGRLVDVGGHRLHLSCSGSGSPTVVIQPGGGEMSSNWAWIVPAVARTTRVCIYDRPGRGWSDPADAPQDGAALAAELHALLQRAGVRAPYVLAGHSFGGLYTLAFAAAHPDEVTGMVLVDSTAPAWRPGAAPSAPTANGSYDLLARLSALAAASSRVGITRLYAETEGASLPPRARDEVRASMGRPDTLQSTIDEYAQAGRSAQQATALTTFAGKPLAVLTAGTGSAPDWFGKQDRLAGLSTNVQHRVVAGATHEALVADEAHAARTTDAILEVVSAARSGAPLSP